MNINFIDINRQYNEFGKEIEQKVLEVLKSGSYIGGKEVELFEKEMASYLNVKHVVSVASGTDALILSLIACNVKKGDQVITTPFTFFATSEAISRVGAIPVFVDIEKDSYNIDSSKIEEKITSKTKAILPVHIFGKCAEMDKINKIAKKHNLYVIEDACQAIGATYKNKKAGALSDVGCFSLYPTKNLGVCGDGGFISTNNEKIYKIISGLKNHGSGKSGNEAYNILFNKKEKIGLNNLNQTDNYDPYKYYNYLIGYNSRLDAINASIGRIKLLKLDELNNKRKKIAQIYCNKLKQDSFICPKSSKNGNDVWHQYAILTENKGIFIKKLSEKGIGSGNFYPVPLHLQKAFLDLNYKEGSLPISENICKRTVCLPIYPELKDKEIEYIIECVNEVSKIMLNNKKELIKTK